MDKKTVGFLVALVAVLAIAFFLWQRGKSDEDTAAKPTPTAEKNVPVTPKRMSGETERAAKQVQPPPPVSMDDDPAGNLLLEGQVLDETDSPVGGAEVTISSNPQRNTTTEDDGSFSFDRLVGRTYVVNARAGAKVGGPVMHKLTATSDPVVVRLRDGASVEVTVIGEDTQKPISGASVQLRTNDLQTEITDAEGKAHFEGVRNGMVAVVASASGYGPTRQPLQVPASGKVEVTAQVTLRPGAAISGRVVNEQGKPVSGARVLAVDASKLFSLESGKLDSVMTNDKGQFRIAAVAAGTYRLAARHDDYAPADSEPMTVDGSTPLTDVELELREGGTVSGRVVDKGGKGVAWAAVRVGRPSNVAMGLGGVLRQATANEQGEFVMKGLPREKLSLLAIGEQASSEAQAEDLTAKPKATDIVLTLTVDGQIAGKVVNDKGEPVAEAQVSALPDIFGQGIPDDLRLRGLAAETTDGGGHFEFRGLPDGTYRLRAARASLSDRAFLQPGTQAATGDTDVTLVLADNGSIKGRLAFDDGGPVKVFTVAVTIPPGIPVANDKGEFVIPDVPPGKHDVTFRGPDFAELSRPGVEVQAGRPTDLGTVTVKRGRYATGHVRDANGQPVAGATVGVARAFRGNGDSILAGVSAVADEFLGLRTDQTNERGEFRIRGLPNDKEMVIIAEHPVTGRSNPELVPPGNDNPTYELTLLPYGSLVGTVTVGGKPERNIGIVVTSKGTRNSSVVVTTAEDGSYVVTRLPVGEYVVLAAPNLGGTSASATAVIEAGKQTRTDLEIEVGDVTLTVVIEPAEGAKIDMAQVFLFKGALAPKTGGEVNEAFLAAGKAGGARMGMAFGTAPAKFENVVPATYNVCVIPITGDMSDPNFQIRLQQNAENLKVYCSRYTVTDTPEEQTYTTTTPGMEPLPEPKPESGN